MDFVEFTLIAKQHGGNNIDQNLETKQVRSQPKPTRGRNITMHGRRNFLLSLSLKIYVLP